MHDWIDVISYKFGDYLVAEIREGCNIPTIIPGLINAYCRYKSGYIQGM
jgi:hypothetical protein